MFSHGYEFIDRPQGAFPTLIKETETRIRSRCHVMFSYLSEEGPALSSVFCFFPDFPGVSPTALVMHVGKSAGHPVCFALPIGLVRTSIHTCWFMTPRRAGFVTYAPSKISDQYIIIAPARLAWVAAICPWHEREGVRIHRVSRRCVSARKPPNTGLQLPSLFPPGPTPCASARNANL